jgi:hypothetical protein
MASDIFLGLIALGVLVMAAIQVGAIVFALKTSRRVEATLGQLQQDIKPIVSNLQAMSADAARATSKAAAQVDRLERVLGDLSRRVDDAATAFNDTLLAPIREATAIVQGIKAAFAAIRGVGGSPRTDTRRGKAAEDEDPMFIG